MATLSELCGSDASMPWIELRGHLSDALLLSSVLRACHDAMGLRVGIVRRPPLSSLFLGHPAVACIAAHAPVEPLAWWTPAESDSAASDWSRLLRWFTDTAIAEGELWAPCPEGSKVLASLPVPAKPLVIAPVPASQRGDWGRERWCQLVEELRILTDTPIAVVALPRVPGLPGAINLSGLLTPLELLGLMGASVGAIGVDAFVLRGAAMHQVPNLAVLGPDWTQPFGASRHLTVSGKRTCGVDCYGSSLPSESPPCAEVVPCMAELSVEQVMSVVRAKLLPRAPCVG